MMIEGLEIIACILRDFAFMQKERERGRTLVVRGLHTVQSSRLSCKETAVAESDRYRPMGQDVQEDEPELDAYFPDVQISQSEALS
jgi:hypothetical protein